MKKSFILFLVISIVWMAGCSSDSDNTEGQTIKFSQNETETTMNSEVLAPSENDGVNISYLDDLYIEGDEISELNVYKAHFHADNSLRDFPLESGYEKFVFDYYYCFQNSLINGKRELSPILLDTISSVRNDIRCDECFKDYSMISLTFPAAAWKKSLGNGKTFEDNQVPFYIVEPKVDDVPVKGGFGSTDGNAVYSCEGVFDYSLFGEYRICDFYKDSAVYMLSYGNYSDLEMIKEKTDIVDFSSIKDSINLGINLQSDCYKYKDAVIYAARLMYIPFVKFDSDERTNVDYNYDYDASKDEIIIDATVYLVPTWTVYFVAVDVDLAWHEITLYINATTGEPMRLSDVSAGDYAK